MGSSSFIQCKGFQKQVLLSNYTVEDRNMKSRREEIRLVLKLQPQLKFMQYQ